MLSTPRPRPSVVELEVLAGLEDVATAEVARLVGDRAHRREDSAPTEVRLDWAGPLGSALGLRTVVAAYVCETYRVPRPRGLLGDATLRRLLDQLAAAVALHPDGAFGSFRFSAAGRKSPVFSRLAEAITEATGMAHDADRGDLLIRVRPAPTGWEVLVRLSPRPLSARSWRVEDLPGALNASIAAAMIEAARPRAKDRFLNLMSGSGTLLIERMLRLPPALCVGVEADDAAMTLSRANAGAAGLVPALLRADARGLPFPRSVFDVLVADLPYGERIGSHQENDELYRATLTEAARVARSGARLVVITHDLRRFEAARAEVGQVWSVVSETQVFQKGHHPKIWVLRRA